MLANKFGKYALSSAIFAAAFVASATDYTVKQSGDWSADATWGGTAPTTTASDNVIFGSAGLNSTISADTTIGTLDVSAGNATISIADGKSLTMNTFILGANKTFTSEGEGTLVLKKTITGTAASGIYNFNSKVDASWVNFVVQDGFTGELNFYNGLNISGAGGDSGRIVFGAAGGILRFGKETLGYTGAKKDYTIAGILNAHTSKAFIIGSDANTTSKAGLMVSNMSVYGTLNVSGVGTWTDFHSSRITGNSVFYAGSEFTQTRTKPEQYKNIISGNLTLKSGVKKFAYGNDVSLSNNAKLTLETSNLITVNGAAQGESTFYLQQMSVKQGGLIDSRVFTSANVTIELLADNEFGAFDFCGASILNLITNGNKVVIGGFTVSDTSSSYKTKTDDGVETIHDLTVEQGSVTLNISNSADNTIFIKSLENLDVYEEDGVLRASNILIKTADGGDVEAFLIAAEGGWYVNSSSTVPEPATVAALFGLFAMAFVAYRKRR